MLYLHGSACIGEGFSPGQVSFWSMAVTIHSEDASGFMGVEFTCQEGSVPGVAWLTLPSRPAGSGMDVPGRGYSVFILLVSNVMVAQFA